MRPMLVLDDVTKVFPRHHPFQGGLKGLVLRPWSVFRGARKDKFVAVSRVSFTVHRGETFGIIGRNGAGKSTILGLVGGIMRPTSGSISIGGRVAPLLEVGVGFTPDLTGRENLVLNGVLLGMRRREVLSKVEQIIEFSGLREFVDQPLKTYSSGMQVRLGFAIAIHSHPDLLLVDEVLAVGDAEFQEKCLGRIATLRKQGVTIVFVSHDLATVRAICDRAAWIDNGRVVAIGEPAEVIGKYEREISRQSLTPMRVAEVLMRSGPREG